MPTRVIARARETSCLPSIRANDVCHGHVGREDRVDDDATNTLRVLPQNLERLLAMCLVQKAADSDAVIELHVDLSKACFQRLPESR